MDNSNLNNTENPTQPEELTETSMQMDASAVEDKPVQTEASVTEESSPVQTEAFVTEKPIIQATADEVEFLAEGADKLREILGVLDERDRCTADMNTLLAEGKKLEGEVKQLKSKLEADIQMAVKNGLIEATAQEDKILTDENIKLKDVYQQREKAKNKGMRDRIEHETKDLTEANKEYRRAIKRGLKENGLPSFCDSNAFFIMYCSQTAVEWVIRLAVFFAMFIVLPSVILLIANPWWLWKLIWWVVIDVIMLAIYMTIYLISKDRDTGTLDEVREFRERIADNEKKIRKIRNDIKKDPDESAYNLGEFDEQIRSIETVIKVTTLKKDEKLKEFEEIKKQTIIDGLNTGRMPEINQRQQALEEKTGIYNELNQKLGQINQSVEEKYEKYLTKQIVNRQTIIGMLELIETNQAANIGQARNLMNR